MSVFLKTQKFLTQLIFLAGAPHPAGSVMTVQFELNGREFLALNGGPQFSFTPAMSIVIYCDTQDEVDHYWQRLTEQGGQAWNCGWLQDRFDVSWQIVPHCLPTLLCSSDRMPAQRVMHAMLKMNKLDIAQLQDAYAC